MTAVVFVGIKLNLKGLGTVSAGIRQDARLYRAWALTGGALGAASMTGIPLPGGDRKTLPMQRRSPLPEGVQRTSRS